jgi:amidophosphoribosyltransferase
VTPLRSAGEACGIVAVYHAGGAVPLAHRALFSLQHRGQEGAGLASWDGDLHVERKHGLVTEGLPIYRVGDMPGTMAIGHCRYSTVPTERSQNIQPFAATTPYGRLAVGHNGNLTNADRLRAELEASGSLMSTSMDTELLVHLIARSGAPDFEGSLRAMAERAVGAYSLTMLLEGRLFGLRDPHGIRPLVLGRMERGWVLASETCALEIVHAEYEREVAPGELVEIGPDGVRSVQVLEPRSPAPCVFEFVYFSRPNSLVFGRSVYAARTAMGEELARRDASGGGPEGTPRPDVVVPVPDSGVPAAIGYARESGVPYAGAILRSHYVGRTFLLPDQDSRRNGIQLKLSVIREAVAGRRVLLVDDSIVRGNTSREIVAMLREAGASEVWLRVASPPIAWPCYLGVDFPDRDELVINSVGSVEGVRAFLGVDDLRYLSLDGLRRATGGIAVCDACMTGEYPV